MKNRADFNGVNAGDLRHRVALQRPSLTQGEGGKPITAWNTLGTYWANVESLTGAELWRARQLKPTTTHRITLRNVATVLPTYRFLFGPSARVLNVDSAYQPEENGAYLVVMATEPKPTT
jgi:SPP1 family predicted phage head-tail adaptor